MSTKHLQILHKTVSQMPASLGYRMPAEWEEHEATWLVWPHQRGTWPGRGRLERVRETLLQMMEVLLAGEKVHLLVGNRVERNEVFRLLRERTAGVENLVAHVAVTADAWVRDYGPLFLKGEGGKKAWVKWRFNAWGRKYQASIKDDRVFQKGSSWIRHRCFEAAMVLEGGSVDVNGAGDCLTTEQCLLNPNRNPSLSRLEIEKQLTEYLGVPNILWLHRGIAGDDTDGHIDNMARFVAPDTILVSYETNSRDVNYDVLNKNWQKLRHYSSSKGGRFRLVKLPMPGKVMHGRMRLPASYANFYVANQVVLLPVYDHPNDKRALKILREHFPTRRVVPIFSRDIVYGLGAIHCLTQQEPR